jgi:hypothetical protein
MRMKNIIVVMFFIYSNFVHAMDNGAEDSADELLNLIGIDMVMKRGVE